MINQIEAFLNEFKTAAKSNFFLVPRAVNNESLENLGLTIKNCKEEILNLTYEDYSKGPEPDNNPLMAGEIWFFGKNIGGKEVYIKLKINKIKEITQAKCLSFHEAEYPISYPFKKRSS